MSEALCWACGCLCSRLTTRLGELSYALYPDTCCGALAIVLRLSCHQILRMFEKLLSLVLQCTFVFLPGFQFVYVDGEEERREQVRFEECQVGALA